MDRTESTCSRRFSPAQPKRRHRAKILPVGTKVGGYTITGIPLSGGFATVYRGVSNTDEFPVAIKILDESRQDAPRAVQRFELEIEAIRSIKHASIVDIFDVGSLPDGRPYYTMEWLDGLSLSEELFLRGPLLPVDALPVIEELGGALSAAHRTGVVHRDLKPDNIIAMPKGNWFSVKLVDFGIAKLIGRSDPQHGLTTTGICLGTVFYMAPEQILCDVIDERTDIYALGVLIYRMLTGAIPFRAPHHVAVQMMHLDDPPPRASDRAPAAKPWDDIIDRCMAKAPSERPDSVEEVVSQLRKALLTQRKSDTTQEQVTIQIEIRPYDDDDDSEELWDQRMSAADQAAEVAEAAGWEIQVEADNAIVATYMIASGSDFAASHRAELISTARTIVANTLSPQLLIRVWIRPNKMSQPTYFDSPLLPAGVYVFNSLLDKLPPPPKQQDIEQTPLEYQRV